MSIFSVTQIVYSDKVKLVHVHKYSEIFIDMSQTFIISDKRTSLYQIYYCIALNILICYRRFLAKTNVNISEANFIKSVGKIA